MELIEKVNDGVNHGGLEKDLTVLFNKKNINNFAFKLAKFDSNDNKFYVKFDACDLLMQYSPNAEFMVGITFKINEMIDPTYAAYLDTSISVNCTDDFERLRYKTISAIWSVYLNFIYYRNTEDRPLVRDSSNPDKDPAPSKGLVVFIQKEKLDYNGF